MQHEADKPIIIVANSESCDMQNGCAICSQS